MKKKTLAVLLTMAVAAAAAGCSGSSEETTAAQSAEETTAEAAEETEAKTEEDGSEADSEAADGAETEAEEAAADGEGGTFTVGFDADFPPMGFRDDDGSVWLFYQGSPDGGESWYISKTKVDFSKGYPALENLHAAESGVAAVHTDVR